MIYFTFNNGQNGNLPENDPEDYKTKYADLVTRAIEQLDIKKVFLAEKEHDNNLEKDIKTKFPGIDFVISCDFNGVDRGDIERKLNDGDEKNHFDIIKDEYSGFLDCINSLEGFKGNSLFISDVHLLRFAMYYGAYNSGYKKIPFSDYYDKTRIAMTELFYWERNSVIPIIDF